MRTLRRLFANNDGATAIEYGLIGVLISVGIIVGVSKVGGAVGNTFNSVATESLGDGTLASP